MAKLRPLFFSLWHGRRAEGSNMASKPVIRSVNGDGFIRVKLPGAGEVRLDLKKHIDNSLKTTSDALNDRYKFADRSSKRDK